MRVISNTVKKKTLLEKLNVIICGLLIVFAFLGKQIAVGEIPAYLFFLIGNLFFLLANNGMMITFPKKLGVNLELHFFCIIMVVIATILLPFSWKIASVSPYITCCAVAIVMLAVAANCKTVADVETFLKFALIGHLIVCAATQYELITGKHFVEITSDYYMRMGEGNAFGFQGNINDNATVLVLCMFSALYFLKRQPLLMTVIIGWTVYLVFMIGSRMAILSVLSIVVIAIMVILFGKIAEYGNNVTRLLLYLLTFIVAITVIFSMESGSFLNLISNEKEYDSDAARITFMADALVETLKNSLFFGNGAGVTLLLIGGNSIHSVFVEVLCDYGIFTIIPLLVLTFKLLTAFVMHMSVQSKIFITAFAVAFTLMSFCSSSMLHIMEPWIMLTLVWRLYLLNTKAIKLKENLDVTGV